MIAKLMSISRVSEVAAVSMRIISAYKNTSLSSDSHLSSMFTELESATTKLSAAIKRTKAESDLEVKDEARDGQVRALFYLIQGFLYHPDTTIKAAAETVDKVFKKYGIKITSESYASESAMITSLLGDLSEQTVQDAIGQLSGCAEVITALETAQADFETARVAYEEEKAIESTELNATVVKKQVLTIINEQIVVYLRAMQTVDETTYGIFALTIAQIIADNNEVVKKRSKKEDVTAASQSTDES